MTLALSIPERSTLAECEAVIERGLQTFIEVGNALLRIREDRLYRSEFGTFQEYCEARWEMDRRRANQLIAASEIVENLGTIVPKPQSEAVVRPLAVLPVPQQREAWKAAVAAAPNGKPTAREVSVAVSGTKSRYKAPKINDGMCTDLEELSGHEFGTIYADPPWNYTNQATRAATSNHYDSMSVDALCAMPVGNLAAEQCHLHLWTTNAFLFDCPRIFAAWGFEFKSTFVWVKPQMGIGNYWRNSHEMMLLAIRGGQRAVSRAEKSWAECSRGTHSAKPEQVRRSIEKLSPGPYLELFGRAPKTGWTVFGNQIVPELVQL